MDYIWWFVSLMISCPPTKYNLPLQLFQWQTCPQKTPDITVFKPHVHFPQSANNRSTCEALSLTFCNICVIFPRFGVASPLSDSSVALFLWYFLTYLLCLETVSSYATWGLSLSGWYGLNVVVERTICHLSVRTSGTGCATVLNPWCCIRLCA